jgi:hypothetical protein
MTKIFPPFFPLSLARRKDFSFSPLSPPTQLLSVYELGNIYAYIRRELEK